MAVITYHSEQELENAITATSVTTYHSEQELATANPQPADLVLGKGLHYTVVVGGTYQTIVVKGSLYFTVVT